MDQIEAMRIAGKVNRDAINFGFITASPGKTLLDIDKAIEDFIMRAGCQPAFKGYRNFPATTCLSPNDTVIHGVPNDYILKVGDILTIDLGVDHEGWKVDAADTQIIQDANTDLSLEDFHIQRELIRAVHDILEQEISVIKHNCTLLDIINAAESTAKKWHVNIFPQFGGHQIGKTVHMDPFIPNCFNRNITQLKQNIEKYKYQNYKLMAGMVICLEPVITFNSTEIYIESDNWTVKTKDKSLAAHAEKCILINQNDCEILS
jgi:methionyl aminopeptidase